MPKLMSLPLLSVLLVFESAAAKQVEPPPVLEAIAARIKTPKDLAHLEAYVIDDSGCASAFNTPEAVRKLPAGVTVESSRQGPFSIYIKDPSVQAFTRMDDFISSQDVPFGHRLVYARTYNYESGAQVGWLALCIYNKPILTGKDFTGTAKDWAAGFTINEAAMKRMHKMGSDSSRVALIFDRTVLVTILPTEEFRGAEAPTIRLSKKATSDPPAAPSAPAFSGPLLGKPFAARIACVVGGSEPNVGIIYFYDARDFDVANSCGSMPERAGERQLYLTVPWKTGTKVDLASLTHDPKRGPQGQVNEALAGGKYDHKWMNRDFQVRGNLEIVRAVNGVGKLGRVRVRLENGTEKLAGEIDVYSTSDAY